MPSQVFKPRSKLRKKALELVEQMEKHMAAQGQTARDAPFAGARTKGEDVIVDEVRDDGWVRLSHLDTWLGWERHADAQDGKERYMLVEAPDVGELLREVVLDEHGQVIDDDDWLPELV